MAVTRDGFPVRHWVFPGNTVDVTTITRVKEDLRGWQLTRCLFVGDAGMVSQANLQTLAKGGGKYLLAMPMQRRFWEHKMRDENDFARHVDYMHFNPVKHGHVQRAVDWPHSIFHRYVRDGVYAHDWPDSMEMRCWIMIDAVSVGTKTCPRYLIAGSG